MESSCQEVQRFIRQRPRRWLITGVAGFIGSHLLEALLKLDPAVVGPENCATGYARNLEEVSEAAFGPRQDPEGAYAAVIPKWIVQLIGSEPVYINGDGETSRDFCHVENAIQANLLAATTDNPAALNQVYNVAVAERTTLNELFELERVLLVEHFPRVRECRPRYREFREGDVRHSKADISKAGKLLGYAPTHRIREGLTEATGWYIRSVSRQT